MMKSSVILAALASLATAMPAAAGIETPLLIAEIQAETPSCSAYPQHGVVGRVAGLVGSYPSRGVSFTGCFPSFAACESWKGPVSGTISGRLTLATCEVRR